LCAGAIAYQTSILDRFDLDPDNSIVELIVPDEFHGKTITELQPAAAMD